MTNNSAITKHIPKRIRRLPFARDLDWLQYSPESDLNKRVETLRDVFPALKAQDESIEYKETYIVAMSARVGSTALLQWLRVVGLANFQEIFNNRGPTEACIREWKTTSLADFLNFHSRQSPNERLAFKIGWWDMAPLLTLIDGDLDNWFPGAKWVYIERRDKIAQAYSLWKASTFGVWHKQTGEQYSSPVSTDIPIDKIRERLQLIRLENDQWKQFFDQHGISPHCIYYEDFLQNPESTMTDVYRNFTSGDPVENIDCPLMRTSDEVDIENVLYLTSKLAA